jgi:hypothetical protein
VTEDSKLSKVKREVFVFQITILHLRAHLFGDS